MTSSLAPLPMPGTDVNPRCDRCKCTAHPGEKCKPRHCGCTRHRDPKPRDAGSITTRGAVLLLALTTAALITAFVVGQDLRCHRLQNTPSASTYCN